MNYTVGFILFIIIFLILTIPTALLIYRRHGYDYQNEIDIYLKSKGIIFSKKRKPQGIDWENSPFEKPSQISFNVGQISLLGTPISSSDTSYYIIETNKNLKVWLQLQTNLFFKPTLIFKEENIPVKQRTLNDMENQKSYNCPACNYFVYESEIVCPDCGLHLK